MAKQHLLKNLFESARPLLDGGTLIDAYLGRADRPARRRAKAQNDDNGLG